MKINFTYLRIFCLLLIVFGCLDPYDPPAMKDNVNFLVVDGFIDSNAGTAAVILTRANVLSEANDPQPEINAQLSVRDEINGNIYLLTGDGNGRYSASGLPLDQQHTYTLAIKTANGSEYASDPVELKASPAIDSVTWRPTPDGIQIYVNTHDPSGKTRYYKWEFDETWEYNAVFLSSFKRVGGVPIYRTEEERLYVCWTTMPSNDILLGSSQRLAQDQITEAPIHFIPRLSVKISQRYSILVRQFALSEAAFDYWQQLQRTTQSVGGLFDPQPARVTGNIHNTGNPSEVVLGYFGAGASQEKRIFIDYRDLPRVLQATRSTEGCTADTVFNAALPDLSNSYLLINQVLQGIVVIGYTYSTPTCADCRTDGGTIVKPDFWD